MWNINGVACVKYTTISMTIFEYQKACSFPLFDFLLYCVSTWSLYVFAASSSAINTQTKPQPGDQQNEGFAVAQ